MLPLMGFLPVDGERIACTIAAIENELMEDGFVRRWKPHDEAPEGTFLACSCWLADCQLSQGRRLRWLWAGPGPRLYRGLWRGVSPNARAAPHALRLGRWVVSRPTNWLSIVLRPLCPLAQVGDGEVGRAARVTKGQRGAIDVLHAGGSPFFGQPPPLRPTALFTSARAPARCRLMAQRRPRFRGHRN